MNRTIDYNEFIKEVYNSLPNADAEISKSEQRVIKYCYDNYYTAEETADYIKYNMGGYSLEEYITDVYGYIEVDYTNKDSEYIFDKNGLPCHIII